MTYLCECCGVEFDEPFIHRTTENLDGERGVWTHTETLCPICGSRYFEKKETEQDAEK